MRKGLERNAEGIVSQEKGDVMKYVAVECSGWDGQPLPSRGHGWQAIVKKTWKWRRLIAETKKKIMHASKNLYTWSRVRCTHRVDGLFSRICMTVFLHSRPIIGKVIHCETTGTAGVSAASCQSTNIPRIASKHHRVEMVSSLLR